MIGLMTTKTRFLTFLASIIGSAIFFIGVSPDTLPVILLLLPFVLILMTAYFGITIVLTLLFGRLSRLQFATSLIISGTVVFLLLVQSVTQLTVRDVVLTVSLCVLLVWYFSRSIQTEGNKQ